MKRFKALLIVVPLLALALAACEWPGDYPDYDPFSFDRYAVVRIKTIESDPGFVKVVMELWYASGSGEVAVFFADKEPDIETLRTMTYEEAFILPTKDKVGKLVDMLNIEPGEREELNIGDVYGISGIHHGTRKIYASFVAFPDENDHGPVKAKIGALEMGDNVINGEPDIDLLDTE